MTEKNEKNTKENWLKTELQVKNELKFLPKGEAITIYPNPPPWSEEIEGRFGKQTMYIVNTNIGNVALNRTQFLKVVARFHQSDFKTPIQFAK